MTHAVPPKIKSTPSPALFAGVTGAFVVAAGLAFVFFFNPSTHRFFPTCLFHQLTGLYCPGCGATRSLYALLHGNFPMALRDNALFVFSIPVAMIFIVPFLLQKRKNPGTIFQLSPKFFWMYLALGLIFAVLRNFPAFSFLSPV